VGKTSDVLQTIAEFWENLYMTGYLREGSLDGHLAGIRERGVDQADWTQREQGIVSHGPSFFK
jgi:hypothetical protein